MTEPRHALVDTDIRRAVDEMLADPEGYFERQRALHRQEAEEYVAAELAKAEEARKSVLTRRFIPKWVFVLIAVFVIPLALYWGVEIGMSKVIDLFPTASVACH